MFIHCTAAIRVGAFWMIRRVLRDGMTIDTALEEAKKVGFREAPHLEQFVRAYIESHKIGTSPAPRPNGAWPSGVPGDTKRRMASYQHGS